MQTMNMVGLLLLAGCAAAPEPVPVAPTPAPAQIPAAPVAAQPMETKPEPMRFETDRKLAESKAKLAAASQKIKVMAEENGRKTQAERTPSAPMANRPTFPASVAGIAFGSTQTQVMAACGTAKGPVIPKDKDNTIACGVPVDIGIRDASAIITLCGTEQTTCQIGIQPGTVEFDESIRQYQDVRRMLFEKYGRPDHREGTQTDSMVRSQCTNYPQAHAHAVSRWFYEDESGTAAAIKLIYDCEHGAGAMSLFYDDRRSLEILWQKNQQRRNNY
jgi:hypothetical protein